MTIIAEKELAQMGKTLGAADHDHDMVHDLSKRLDALWRYDQYIANAEDQPQLKEFWQDVKEQEKENIARLKELIRMHCSADCS